MDQGLIRSPHSHKEKVADTRCSANLKSDFDRQLDRGLSREETISKWGVQTHMLKFFTGIYTTVPLFCYSYDYWREKVREEEEVSSVLE